MSRKTQPHYADPKGIIANDFRGNGLLAAGTTVPSDATPGYAAGCIFADVDASAGSQLFINEGSATSSDFNAFRSNTIANALALQSAYTQTAYSTADKTVAAPTAATLTGTSTGTADGVMEAEGTLSTGGGNTYSDAAVNTVLGKIENNIAELFARVNQLIADDLDNRKSITALIDDLQANGLVG